MVNKYYQKHKEKLRKEAHTRCQNLSEEENDKRRKRLEKDIKILLKRKNKKVINIMRNISSYLSKEDVII